MLLLSNPPCLLSQAVAHLAAATGWVTGGELLAKSLFSSAVLGQQPWDGQISSEQPDNSRKNLSGFFIVFMGNFSCDITNEVE